MLELSAYMLVFIALSGLMALIDAAVLSVSQAEVEEMVLLGEWGAPALRSIKQRISRAVVVIVLFTNTVNILGPILAGNKAIEIYGEPAIGVITAILTFGTIVFSEIIPKSLGAHYAPLISRLFAPSILFLIYALFPLVVALEWISNLFKSGRRPIGTEAQIRSLVKLGHLHGYIESDEGQLIHRAFLLNDRTAADVMTPLKDVVSVPASATIRQAAQSVFRSAYSRFPVFSESSGELQGMLLTRDILEALSEGRDEEPITEIIHPALIVQSETRSDMLLVMFRDRRIHLAMVQKDGKNIGLVTLEDVLEELVGEIEDEKDELSRLTSR